ncbi:MAG: hypothetical protein GTN53_15470, partial [Candidatus Aminicenantes bacterium]|nr:hypothetical protein [Candidatus Aminicenantes bacterium]
MSGWTTAVAYTTIDLLWNDNSGGDETGFRIERCMGSGCSGFTTIATVGPNITTFSDPGLAMNTVYNYQIVAEGTGGDSAPSNASEAQTGPDSGPPSQPANVVGVADIAGCFIELTWDPSSDDIKVVGYNIYRDSDPTPIATVSGTSYIDGGLDPG